MIKTTIEINMTLNPAFECVGIQAKVIPTIKAINAKNIKISAKGKKS